MLIFRNFSPGGPPLATGGAAMGSAVATGGLPWFVSTGPHFPSFRSQPSRKSLISSLKRNVVS